MYKINDDLSIYVTRGDIVLMSVSAEYEGKPYTFVPGDVVRIKVFKKKKCTEVALQKDFPVTAVTQNVQIYLSSEDTKIGEVISKPVDYWYEVEVNPLSDPQTIIGYDEDGAKVFKLFPEGADKELEEYEPGEEDILSRFMDDELDLTSKHPVENQAIARGILRIQEIAAKAHEAVANLYVTPEMFGAIGDGVSDDTEAFKKAIETAKTIYIPSGRYLITDTLELTGCEYISGNKDSVLVVDTTILFSIKSYYDNACIIDGLTVELNKNTLIKSNRGSWGSSYVLKNIVIKNCGNNTIVNSEGYNITLDNCIFVGDSTATGTMIKLCDDSAKMFSNVIVFNSCVLSGNENMDLVDCSKSYRANAYNTTFTGCKTAIIGTMGCFGCWFETVELCSTGKNPYYDCHFANVTRMNAKTKDEDDNYIIPSLVSNPTFKANDTTILAETFKRQPQQLFYPKVAGLINGVYSEFLPFSIYSNKVVANVPLNTFYKEGTGNSMSLPIPDISSVNIGVLFVELECYRVLDGEVKQASKSRGILKDNVYTELEKTDKDTTYKSTFTWNAPNQLFTISDWHEGTLIAKCHIERVTA